MEITKFFKVLAYKINKYDVKYKTNPFTAPQTITLVWIENNKPAVHTAPNMNDCG